MTKRGHQSPRKKAIVEKLQRLKGERKGKLAQLTKQKNDLEKMMKNEDSVNFIKDEALLMFERINEELRELMDEDEKKVDQDAFKDRHSDFKRFVEETNQ